MSQPTEKRHSIHHQAIRFGALSAVSFTGYLGLTALMHEVIGISSFIAVPIAMGCMTAFNFFTLKLAVFPKTEQHWFKQFLGFVSSIAGFRVLEYAAFVVLHGLMLLPYLPVYASILAISAICKFLFLRNILFAPRPAGLVKTAS